MLPPWRLLALPLELGPPSGPALGTSYFLGAGLRWGVLGSSSLRSNIIFLIAQRMFLQGSERGKNIGSTGAASLMATDVS